MWNTGMLKILKIFLFLDRQLGSSCSMLHAGSNVLPRLESHQIKQWRISLQCSHHKTHVQFYWSVSFSSSPLTGGCFLLQGTASSHFNPAEGRTFLAMPSSVLTPPASTCAGKAAHNECQEGSTGANSAVSGFSGCQSIQTKCRLIRVIHSHIIPDVIFPNKVKKIIIIITSRLEGTWVVAHDAFIANI